MDKAAAEKLAEIAGVKCEELASEMFAAGSNLKNKSPEEIFYQDFKKFELNKSSFGVGQITSVNADELTEIKKELLPYMEKSLQRRSRGFGIFHEQNPWIQYRWQFQKRRRCE